MSKADMIFDAIVQDDLEELKKQLSVDPLLVNALGRENLTPLHIAAREGNRDIAMWLVAHGADTMAVDAKHGDTPLGWAAYYGKIDVVDALLKTGANAKHENGYGLTPYQVAEEGTRGKWAGDTAARPEDYRKIMALLHDHGAAPTRSGP